MPFQDQTDDLASEVMATGVTCDGATELVGQVSADHNFVSGPRRFSTRGCDCTVQTDDDALPIGRYRCTKGPATVTWSKT